MTLGAWAVVLLVLGLMVLVAEVFIPSGGLLMVVTAGTLVGSLICAWLAWWPARPAMFWGFLSTVVGLIPVTVVWAFWVWPSTAIGRRALLEGPTAEQLDAFHDEAVKFAGYVGQVGTTATVLNPAGMLELGTERLHCQSEGTLVEAGVSVVVVRTTHNLVIVRPTRESPGTGAATRVPPGPGEPPPTLRTGTNRTSVGTISEDPLREEEIPPEFA